MCTKTPKPTLADVLYMPEINSIPEAISTYIDLLRKTGNSDDIKHANMLSYYLNVIKHKNYLSSLRRTFNDIYALVEKEYPSIRFKIDGRRKSLISTEKKILKNVLEGNSLLKDILGVRVILLSDGKNTDSAHLVELCYKMMELISEHLSYKGYIQLEDKDYIKNPSKTGYQSLHAIFRFPGAADTFEVQIRTFWMHVNAEHKKGQRHDEDYKKEKYSDINFVLDRTKIKIPGYIYLDDGTIEDLIGLDQSFSVIARSKTF